MSGTPWVGEPRRDRWWKDFHKDLLKQTTDYKSDLEVIFFGDSITEHWLTNGKDVWDKHYAPRHAYNYGISADRTEHVIWRMEHGLFDALNAKLIVLRVGTNNICSDTKDHIAMAIKVIIDQLLERQPNASILLLSILPMSGSYQKRVEAVNDIIAEYEDQKRVFYLDMTSHFQTAPGLQKSDLYEFDRLHISGKGYQLQQQLMEPLFSKLLNN